MIMMINIIINFFLIKGQSVSSQILLRRTNHPTMK